jgi:hypothetical protein
MDPKNVETLNTILSYWESDFPGLNTVATSAVWADQVQLCSCKFKISWHPPKTDEICVSASWFMDHLHCTSRLSATAPRTRPQRPAR